MKKKYIYLIFHQQSINSERFSVFKRFCPGERSDQMKLDSSNNDVSNFQLFGF